MYRNLRKELISIFSEFQNIYPNVDNLIRLEFYSNDAKNFELVGEFFLIKPTVSQKQYYFTNKNKILRNCRFFINEELKNEWLLSNFKIGHHNILNVCFTIKNDSIEILSFGYEENCKEYPDFRAIY